MTPAGRAYEHEYRIVRPDGALRWLRARVRPIFDEHGEVVRIASVIEDITDHKAADLALRESEERYRRLVEASPDAIFVHQGAASCTRTRLRRGSSVRPT